MEVCGDFALEDWVEVAWIMGHIKHFISRLKNGSLCIGWVESKSSKPVNGRHGGRVQERHLGTCQCEAGW